MMGLALSVSRSMESVSSPSSTSRTISMWKLSEPSSSTRWALWLFLRSSWMAESVPTAARIGILRSVESSSITGTLVGAAVTTTSLPSSRLFRGERDDRQAAPLGQPLRVHFLFRFRFLGTESAGVRVEARTHLSLSESSGRHDLHPLSRGVDEIEHREVDREKDHRDHTPHEQQHDGCEHREHEVQSVVDFLVREVRDVLEHFREAAGVLPYLHHLDGEVREL